MNNDKPERSLDLFQPYIASVSPFKRSLLPNEMTNSPTRSYASTRAIPTLSYT